MAVQYPYRAVICGEEHIVKGWRGRKLLTDKGIFWVSHIYGKWRIQDYRLFEVTLIQPAPDGGWLLNGIHLSHAETVRFGLRFADVADDENLRVHKGKVCALARVQAASDANVTSALDAVLEFWKKASLPVVESNEESLLERHLFLKALEALSNAMAIPTMFKGWSTPIWLTEFCPAGEGSPLSPEQKKLACVTAELNQERAHRQKAEEAAGAILREALLKWMRFDPPRIAAATKAKIEKAVKLYLTDPDKQSLAKIAAEFKVSRKTVSEWFKVFTKETGFKVVTQYRHESVKERLRAEAKQRLDAEAWGGSASETENPEEE